MEDIPRGVDPARREMLREALFQEHLEEAAQMDPFKALQFEHLLLKRVFEAMSKHHAQLLHECTRLQRENGVLSHEVGAARETIERLRRTLPYTQSPAPSPSRAKPGNSERESSNGYLSAFHEDRREVATSPADEVAATNELSRIDNKCGTAVEREGFSEVQHQYGDKDQDEDRSLMQDESAQLVLRTIDLNQFLPSTQDEEPETVPFAGNNSRKHLQEGSPHPSSIEKLTTTTTPSQTTLQVTPKELVDYTQDMGLDSSSPSAAPYSVIEKRGPSEDLLVMQASLASASAQLSSYKLNERTLLQELEATEEHNRRLCARLQLDTNYARRQQLTHTSLIESMEHDHIRFAQNMQRRANELESSLMAALDASNRRVGELTAERERLQYDLEMTREELEKSRASVHSAQQSISALQAEIVSLNERSLRKQVEHEEELRRASLELQKVSLLKHESEREVEALRAELQVAQSQLERLRRNSHTTLDTSTQSIAASTVSSADIPSAAILQQELVNLRKKYRDADDERLSLSSRVQTLTQSLKAKTEELVVAHEVEASLRATLAETKAKLESERIAFAAEKLRLELDHAEALSQAVENAAEARLRLTREVVQLEDSIIDDMTSKLEQSSH